MKGNMQMALFGDEPTRQPGSEQVVGADLSALSVEELKERASQLQRELVRIDQEISVKLAMRTAADDIFKS